jgi:ABC-2 type transport system permease protein
MAVYKRNYKAYTGPLTPEWTRLFAIPRQAWKGVFKQRFLTIFYVVCFCYPLGCAVAIYLNHNLGSLASFIPIPMKTLFDVDGKFFLRYTNFQGVLAFILTALVGPGLVSPDLTNGALPLYFCRPFSRTEYVTGKLLVLAGLLSYITWIPGLMLYGLQGSLEGWDWFVANAWLAWSTFVVSMVWILLLSMLALALSAWVRWKIVAGALMLVVFFMGAGISATINNVMNTENGGYLDLGSNLERVATAMFAIDLPTEGLTLVDSLSALGAAIAICVFLLMRKVKAYEVVR